jgi:hypothetical protein
MLFQAEMTTIGALIGELLAQYGITGLAFGALLTIMLRQNKASQQRIENLELQQQKEHKDRLSDQREMIQEYVELVKNKTRVLADLTGCLNAIKSTLERIEHNKKSGD